MDNWYYEYEVEVLEDGQSVLRRGVICADSFSVVAFDLEQFYGNSLDRINKIACIMEGLYEFNRNETEFKVDIGEEKSEDE